MYENIYVGDRLVTVLEGEHYGEVIRDAMTGDIILFENNRIVALGCTADASSQSIDFWEKKIHTKISFRLSKDTFRDTGLNKAIVLPLKKRKIEESPVSRISPEEEIYYLKRDLNEADRIIDTLKSELMNKEKRIQTMLEALRIINRQTYGF